MQIRDHYISTGFIKLPLLLFFSFSAFCGQAQNLNNPNKRGPLGTQVNTLSGNLFLPRTDIHIPARGFDLRVSFSYNSFLFTEDYGYGKGWLFNYHIRYSNDTVPGAKLVLWGDGREDTYDSMPGGSYQSPKGFFNIFSQYQPNKYLLTELNGVKYFFDNPVHKRITKQEDPNGNFISFNYTDTLLTSITNNAGQTITFTYNAKGKLATVVDAIASPTRTFQYNYDAAGNLKEIIDPLNGKYQYTYLINGPMKSLADKNNNKVDIIYYPDLTIREIVGCNKRMSFSYDTSSQVTVVTDHLESGNQVTKYTYAKVDNLSWITSMSGNCCGFNINYEYDDEGNQIKMIDANGQEYTYTYDSTGNVLTATDPFGSVSSYTYTSDFKKINRFLDPKGNTYTLSYDPKGNLVQLITPGNNIYTATYNASGDIITGTDPKGNTYNYNYDAFGNPTNVTGPNGYSALLSYDARGRLLSYTDARGNNSSAEYDILNRLKKITDPINHVSQFNYDAAGNLTTFINPNNETGIINYDASNRVIKITGATGNQASFKYDGMDNLLSVKNSMGYETKFTYDNRNRLKSLMDPENNNVVYSYDANGNITSAGLPNGQSLNYTYDKLNRLTMVSDATSTIAVFTYDKNNNITSFKNATGAITTANYDSLDRIKQMTDPLGNLSAFTYDKKNNITSVTDREGRTSHYTYDGLNRVKTYTDKNGFLIAAGYDAQGNVISLTDQNGNITTYTYDELNRRKRMIYPDGKYNELTYNNKGNIISLRQTDATVINYHYDTLNRVISRSIPGGEVYGYTYDKLGRVLTATNNNGTVSFSYDSLNRITSETYDGRTTRYNYNVAGRVQTIIYPDNAVVIKEFDTRSRLIRVLKDSVLVAAYTYNNVNQLTQKNFGNGAGSIMQYDFANRLSSLATVTPGGNIQNSQFSYDKEYNKTAVTRSLNSLLSEQFVYDNNDRLINYKRGPAGSPVIQNTYTYDAVGNRTSANLNGVASTYTINNLNQLTGINGNSFTFDNRGNLTYDGTFYKTYDAENRLIKDSSSPASVITYAYDAMRRRVTKSINGNLLKYTYSGAAPIEERDASNNLLNSTVFTNFLSPVLNEKNSNKFYFHPNELGSVEAITNSNGRLIESYRYDVYGKLSRYDSLNNPLASSPAGNRFGFTGQEYDSASGSYRFFFRNYSPETGVFNQRDLLEYSDGMGMYQYVGNNPANGVDVWGLEGSLPCANLTKVNKLRLISKNLIVEQQNKVVQEAIDQWWEEIPGLGRIAAGVNADSKFYTDVSGSGGTVGGIDYYFDGQVMKNYEVNYYFTAYANASRGWSQFSIDRLTTTWNLADGAKDYVVDGLNGERLDQNPLKMKYNELPTKMDISQKGYEDYHSDTRVENLAMKDIPFDYQYKQVEFGEWWPVFNPATGEITHEFFVNKDIAFNPDPKLKEFQMTKVKQYLSTIPCLPSIGTRKPRPKTSGDDKEMLVSAPFDPNEILGPTGVPDKAWVSVKDRLPYTVLFENDSTATARARFVKITSPIEPKQDATTLELGSIGFNNQSFDIPPGRSSYYERLDVRDSTGVYVDLTAGYDIVNNQVFWELQSIDPITLMPPEDPLAGFLFLHDESQPAYGNGFVNFTIKPKQNAQTLDTIGARAEIIFDENEAIPTNIHSNTIDAVAPTSHMNAVSGTDFNAINLSWSGADDPNGCGIDYYSIYISKDQVNYSVLIPQIRRTDTTISLPPDTLYCFFVLATDRVGNREVLRQGEITCAYFMGAVPVTWLYFNGTNQDKNNLLKWATANETNSKEFRLERSLNGVNFTQIAVIAASGNSSTPRDYSYLDRNIDLLRSPVMFYRLKQVDISGNYQYSNIVKLSYHEAGKQLSLAYPNPTNGIVSVLLGDAKLLGTEGVVTDVNGRTLQRFKLTSLHQSVNLGQYVNGVYFIRLRNKEILKVVKQ